MENNLREKDSILVDLHPAIFQKIKQRSSEVVREVIYESMVKLIDKPSRNIRSKNVFHLSQKQI